MGLGMIWDDFSDCGSPWEVPVPCSDKRPVAARFRHMCLSAINTLAAAKKAGCSSPRISIPVHQMLDPLQCLALSFCAWNIYGNNGILKII